MILVAVPLTFGTQKVFRQSLIKFTTASLVQKWAEANGWKVIRMDVWRSDKNPGVKPGVIKLGVRTPLAAMWRASRYLRRSQNEGADRVRFKM